MKQFNDIFNDIFNGIVNGLTEAEEKQGLTREHLVTLLYTISIRTSPVLFTQNFPVLPYEFDYSNQEYKYVNKFETFFTLKISKKPEKKHPRF